MTVTHSSEAERQARARRRRLRAALLVVVLGGVYTAMHVSGLLDEITVDWVRQRVLEAGRWGQLAYMLVFVAGVLFYVPGFIFVIAGVLVFGPLHGGLLAWAAGLLASHAAFLSTRFLGGDVLTAAEQPLVRRLMDHVEDHPVRTAALLRCTLYLSPPATIALALSPIRLRQHLLGTLLGFTPVTIGYALFTDLAVAWLLG